MTENGAVKQTCRICGMTYGRYKMRRKKLLTAALCLALAVSPAAADSHVNASGQKSGGAAVLSDADQQQKDNSKKKEKEKQTETKSPETNPPETKPPETNPPETNPPETKPSETNPPETNPH